MAKKKESVKVVPLRIKWIADGAPSVFANQMIVQADEHDFHLSFFEVVPPLVVGDLAEQRKQVEEMREVPARCVVRVVINVERMQTFIDAMQATLIKYKAHRDEFRNANGEE